MVGVLEFFWQGVAPWLVQAGVSDFLGDPLKPVSYSFLQGGVGTRVELSQLFSWELQPVAEVSVRLRVRAPPSIPPHESLQKWLSK